MEPVPELLTKQGQVVVEMARMLIGHEVNQRLEPVSVYADRLKVGRGTVQGAFQALEAAGAVRFQRRGHLGTYLVEIDRQRLWKFTGYGVIAGAMPLPYTRRYEGLATALYKAFERAAMPFSMAYVRGSTNRVEALRLGRFHFAVVSELAAEMMLRQYDDISLVRTFHDESYVQEHAVIMREGAGSRIRDGMRVGIDVGSADQAHLTRLECEGKDVEFVELNYMNLVDRLRSGDIDAAVWSTEEVQPHGLVQLYRGLKAYPFTHEEACRLSRKNTRAAIVVAKPQIRMTTLLEQFLDPESIRDVQMKVLSGELLPSY